jgi:hypothetical protein
MKTQLYRVSLSFIKLVDGDLPPFGTGVIDHLTDNPNFPDLPVSLPVLTAANANFGSKLAAMTDGTRKDTVAKNNARRTLENMLRQEAAYVQSVASENLGMLLSSGFEAISNNRARIELQKPVINRVENPASAQLALRLKPVPTARAYEVRLSYAGGAWQNGGVFTQARKIVLTDLTPGTTYTVQARAIGGSTGASDWSDPVSHMSL